MSAPSERGRCPICGKPLEKTAARFAPFCGRRCADIDLGRWLKEDYRLPGEAPARSSGQGPEEGLDRDQDPGGE